VFAGYAPFVVLVGIVPSVIQRIRLYSYLPKILLKSRKYLNLRDLRLSVII